jgi:hypothetical protein
MNSLFSASSGRLFCVYTFLSVRVVLEKEGGERTSMQDRSETSFQLWSVRVSISVKILQIKLIN